MREPAKPNVLFSVRLDLESDRRRKRLLRSLKISAPELMKRALYEFEASLNRDRHSEPEARVA
jgi:hypothetical protein